ncbi:MAG: lactate utilization protein, partial [Methanomicrobiales archaeon]|nr:lactate utilization protein [Methanomicrobiales archaeon]
MADATQQMVSTVTRYSAVNLMADAGVDAGRWNRIPDDAAIERTVAAIEARNIRVILVDTAKDAL